MNRMQLSIVSAALALPIIATTLAGAAGNLVANGDFSQGTLGWTSSDQDVVLSPTAGGALSAGRSTPGAAFVSDAVAQCVQDIDDSHEYAFQIDMFIPLGQGRSGDLFGSVVAFPSADCAGPGAYAVTGTPLAVPGTYEHQSNTFVPGAGTKSLMISLRINRRAPSAGQSAADLFRGEFDNISLASEALAGAVVPVFPQGPFDIVIPGPLGQGPKAVPTSQPSGPSNPEPQQPQQPKSDEPTADVPITQPEAPTAVAEATPLPPSTGTGLMSDSRSMVPLLGAAFLALSSAFTAAGALIRRR